ncbi:MAG: hypothetical protein ACLUNV_04205 [Sutterella wadsworthensis]
MALVIDAGAFTQSAGHDFTKADVSALGNNTTVNLTGGDLELVNVTKLGEPRASARRSPAPPHPTLTRTRSTSSPRPTTPNRTS